MKKDILGLGHGGLLGITLKPSYFQKTTKIYKNVTTVNLLSTTSKSL